MQPLTRNQLLIATAIFIAVAVAGSAFLKNSGAPELVPAALVAQTWTAVGLFLRYRVDRSIWRPYLAPGVVVAAGTVLGLAYYARSSPWAMTPAFLAPELPIEALVEELDSRLQTKVRLTAEARWWDEYPFGTGLTDPIKVRVENETGSMDVILDRAALERDIEEGQLLKMVGRIRKWEGGIVRFVALEVEFVGAPAGE